MQRAVRRYPGSSDSRCGRRCAWAPAGFGVPPQGYRRDREPAPGAGENNGAARPPGRGRSREDDSVLDRGEEAAMWETIGWIGSGIVVISMLQQRITRLRLINLAGCLVSLAYAVAIAAWPLAGLNAVLAGIQIVHLHRLWATRHDAASYTVVRVDPHDDIVAHVLARHAADIKRWFPQFTAATETTLAHLVLNADTVVGIQLATRHGDVAQLAVDYVIPAYQDLTPGEFIFRRSALWRELGVRLVRSPRNGPDYYARLGFTRRGDHYELTLAQSGHATPPGRPAGDVSGKG